MKVSNSEIRTFKQCRRRWWLTYYRKLRRIHEGPGPLSIGNMIHVPLEVYYTGKDDPGYLMELHNEYGEDFVSLQDHCVNMVLTQHVEKRLAEVPENMHADMLKDWELAKIMLEGYFEWLTEEGSDMDLEILSAEKELEAYLGTIEGVDVTLIAKLDVEALVRSTGDRLFLDHKSVANLADLPKTAKLDEQNRTYGLIQRMSGATERCVGCIFNMLRKVKRTARSNPPFYGRFSVAHNDEVFRTFYLRVWGEVRDMILLRQNLDAGADHQVVAYPNPTRDCSWSCPFYGICYMFDDGSDVEVVIADDYEVHDPYERYTELEKA